MLRVCSPGVTITVAASRTLATTSIFTSAVVPARQVTLITAGRGPATTFDATSPQESCMGLQSGRVSVQQCSSSIRRDRAGIFPAPAALARQRLHRPRPRLHQLGHGSLGLGRISLGLDRVSIRGGRIPVARGRVAIAAASVRFARAGAPSRGPRRLSAGHRRHRPKRHAAGRGTVAIVGDTVAVGRGTAAIAPAPVRFGRGGVAIRMIQVGIEAGRTAAG
jgi:hypothetical protein